MKNIQQFGKLEMSVFKYWVNFNKLDHAVISNI